MQGKRNIGRSPTRSIDQIKDLTGTKPVTEIMRNIEIREVKKNINNNHTFA